MTPASSLAATLSMTKRLRCADSSQTCRCTRPDPDIDPQQYLSSQLCKHIPTREDNWAYDNTARSCNPEYDELFDRLSQTSIGPERASLIKQMNDIHVQSYYEISLVSRGLVSAHLNSLQGIRINGWDSELWNISEWRR